MRKPRGHLAALTLLALLGAGAAQPASPAEAVTARSALVHDPVEGVDLVADDADAPRPPASTAKLMTALLAAERLDLDGMLPVSKRAAGMPRTKADLRAGGEYRVGDLLRALLVGSANDAAAALAEGISGSEAGFAKLMTERARELGCRHTRFANASGLPHKDQVSTCRDLLKIFAAVRRSPALMAALSDPSFTLAHPDGKRTVIRNHNKLLGSGDCPAVGKTGYTRSARHCFVGSFVREGREYHVAFLGSRKIWTDLKALMAVRVEAAGRAKAVQEALSRLGYDPGPVDGILGPRTRKALKRFQEAQGLEADAVPGEATRGALSRLSGIPIP